MPNTLVHLGVAGLTGRALAPGVDLRLVYLSCVIPDVPWIVQRAAHALAPDIDRIALNLWCAVQSSLLFCLVFSAAVAVPALRPLRVFAILSAGSALHLALDIIQIKWGRGVIFFAPFDWRVDSLDIVWPEHPVFYMLLAASAVFVAATWRSIDHLPLFTRPAPARWLVVATLAVSYAAGPALFVGELDDEDAFYAATIADTAGRVGRTAWFDRAPLRRDADGALSMEIFSGERILLLGIPGTAEGLVSVKGRFETATVFRAEEYHLHPAGIRVGASLLGLVVVAAVWAQSLVAWQRRRSGVFSRRRRRG